MQPVDKFGRHLYPKVYETLLRCGNQLESYGYREALSTSNLFYFNYKRVTFFADMRGTEDVPIWKFPIPLFYWQPTKGNEYYIRMCGEEAALIEVCRLHDVPLRLSGDAKIVNSAPAKDLIQIVKERIAQYLPELQHHLEQRYRRRSFW